MLGVAEQQAREHEQVVELELTGDPARVDVGARELGDGDRERADDRAGDLAQRPFPFVGQAADAVAELLDVAPPGSLAADRCTLNDGCGRRSSSSRSAVSRAARSFAA